MVNITTLASTWTKQMGFIGRSLRHKLAWAADCALKPFLDNVALLMEKLVRVFDQGILREPDGTAY